MRGWETAPLPAPDGSGALTAALDLSTHEAVVKHSDGRAHRIPLTPNRPVADVARDVLAALETLVGPVHIHLQPQEVPWTARLDEDREHHTYDPAQVAAYFSAATRAALVLAALRAPYRGRSTAVNAWWGSFDLAVALFSGRPAEPRSQDFIERNSGDAEEVMVGWWPGDARHPQPAFYAYASPAPPSFGDGILSPPAARWDTELGEYLLDWDDVIASHDPHGAALAFGRSVIARACAVCNWGPELAASAQGVPRAPQLTETALSHPEPVRSGGQQEGGARAWSALRAISIRSRMAPGTWVRRVPRGGQARLAPSPGLPALRTRRLLRFLAGPAHHRAQPRHRTSRDPLVRAGRGLVLLLSG